MTEKEVYRIWAPVGKKWVDWVRPVAFVEINEHSKNYILTKRAIPDVTYVDPEWKDMAIVVDLYGADSVREGLALAKEGYRPIPIYNGTIEQEGARATVNNQSVGMALFFGATDLKEMSLAQDARPAFLLDKSRLARRKVDVSVFDNSWDVYAQDMPTGDYLYNNGIRRLLVVSPDLSVDLHKILYKYRRKKIQIYITDGFTAPSKITVRRPLLPERY